MDGSSNNSSKARNGEIITFSISCSFNSTSCVFKGSKCSTRSREIIVATMVVEVVVSIVILLLIVIVLVIV